MTKTLRLKTLLLLNALFLWSSILFAQVSVEDYYQPAAGKTGNELKTTLHNIIKGHTELPYTSSEFDVWDALKQTDEDPNDGNNVILIYTGRSEAKANQDDGSGGDLWNREHIWAKSHALGDPYDDLGAATDIHALRACDASVNSDRSNRFFDNGGTAHDEAVDCKYDDNDFTWEPRDAVKGDIARMIFYMAVRYEGEGDEPDLELTDDLSYSTISNKDPIFGKISTLKEWNILDPVDNIELARNEKIYEIQGNRNPFINHPEWVDEVWTTVVDTESPTVTELSPLNSADDVSLTANLIITFNEEIKEGTGKVTIKRYSDDSVFETHSLPSARLSFPTSNQLLINPETKLEEGVKYYVLIDNGVITDLSSNAFQGISDKTVWNYTTTHIAPEITEFIPANNSVNIPVNTNLEITFDKNVKAGDGDITIQTNGNEIMSIPASTSSIDGATVTIQLSGNLESNTSYTVLIDGNAFQSENGLPFEGITSSEYWNFMTEIITGIDDSFAKGAPSFYPNPTKNEIRLTNTNNIDYLQIMDLAGRKIMEIQSPDKRILLTHLPEGMYLVTFILNDGSRITKKILKH